MECVECGAGFAPREARIRTCSPACRDAYRKSYGRRLRAEALGRYGGKCACCGESQPAFLQLDHLNDDGNEHRKLIREPWTERPTWHAGGNGAGLNTYQWLRNHSWPPIMQVLCANCNFAKLMAGECPHASRD